MATAYTEAQEEYWQVTGLKARALAELWSAEAAVEAFSQEHPGESFRVFRPEDIDRLMNPDIKPLFDGDDED